jgi:hypothetical protein
MLAAFTLSYYYACIKLQQIDNGSDNEDHLENHEDEDTREEETTLRRIDENFGLMLQQSLFVSFGDFGSVDDYVYWDEYLIFILMVLFLCLIMLNLLIGIVSNEMEQVLET